MKLVHLFFVLLFAQTKSNHSKNTTQSTQKTEKIKMDPYKEKFCAEVKGCVSVEEEVCGIRQEGERFHLKIFPDQCALMRFSCQVLKEDDTYGIINMQYCNTSFREGNKGFSSVPDTNSTEITLCSTYTCTNEIDNDIVCGIREHGNGYKIRLFVNECHLFKYNCLNRFEFQPTERHICDGLELPIEFRRNLSSNKTNESLLVESVVGADGPVEETKDNSIDNNTTTEKPEYFGDNGVTVTPKRKMKNLVIVDDASLYDINGNINDTVDNFFSATHVFDMPLRNIEETMDQNTRRRIVDTFGPVLVFKPWVKIPKNISFDIWHQPTLKTCFQKCPIECPSTYAPVCGAPGNSVRHPAVMFQNHCFMDVAQCKMRWDNTTYDSQISTYIESSFLFCLGDKLSALYKFLPLIRTLQRMGRLKKKGHYHMQLKNMRFFNELLRDTPRLMG